MKTNTYFEELDRIARDFEERHEAHKALKQQIIDTKGWDSEELKAWYKEEPVPDQRGSLQGLQSLALQRYR